MRIGDALLVLGAIFVIAGSVLSGSIGVHLERTNSFNRGCGRISQIMFPPGSNKTLTLCIVDLKSGYRGTLRADINVSGGLAVLAVEKNGSVIKEIPVSGSRHATVKLTGPGHYTVKLVLASGTGPAGFYAIHSDIRVDASAIKEYSSKGLGTGLVVAGIILAGLGALLNRKEQAGQPEGIA